MTANKIAAGAVDSGALANGSVSGAKLANGSVTDEKLGPNAVTGAKIAGGTITAATRARRVVKGKAAPERAPEPRPRGGVPTVLLTLPNIGTVEVDCI